MENGKIAREMHPAGKKVAKERKTVEKTVMQPPAEEGKVTGKRASATGKKAGMEATAAANLRKRLQRKERGRRRLHRQDRVLKNNRRNRQHRRRERKRPPHPRLRRN